MNKLLGLCLLFFGMVGCSSSQYPSNEMYYKEERYAQQASQSEQSSEEEGIPLYHKRWGRIFIIGMDSAELIEQYRIRGEKHMILDRDTNEVTVNALRFKYVGKLRDGDFGGRGLLTHYEENYVYDGYFNDGKMDGVGIATLSNGKVRAGIWKGNNLVEEHPVSKVRELLTDKDKKMGFVEINLGSGARYVGGVKEDVGMHGQGTITYPDGTRALVSVSAIRQPGAECP